MTTPLWDPVGAHVGWPVNPNPFTHNELRLERVIGFEPTTFSLGTEPGYPYSLMKTGEKPLFQEIVAVDGGFARMCRETYVSRRFSVEGGR